MTSTITRKQPSATPAMPIVLADLKYIYLLARSELCVSDLDSGETQMCLLLTTRLNIQVILLNIQEWCKLSLYCNCGYIIYTSQCYFIARLQLLLFVPINVFKAALTTHT